MVYSENFIKHPFEQRFRKLNRGDLSTNVWNGQFIEQRFVRESRRIGSVKGFVEW